MISYRLATTCFLFISLGLFSLFGQHAIAESPASAAPNVKSVADLFSLEDLPRVRNFRTYLASSYDREGGNYDLANYERVDGDENVILDVTGPGMITRIWSANPRGVLRIYLDDTEQPVVQENFGAFLRRAPLAIGRGTTENLMNEKVGMPGGLATYCVIPFQKRCKITLTKVPNVYHQVNYLLFDKPHQIPPFTADSAKQLRTGYDKIRQDLAWDLSNSPSSWQHKKGVLKLGAGDKATIFDEKGPLTIRRMTFSVKWPTDARQAKHLKEKLLLRGYWDDDSKIPNDKNNRRNPSIKSPLALFFMDFGGLKDYRTALVIKEGDTYACRFPMPVCERALLELVNDSVLDVDEIEYDIAYEPMATWDSSLANFKAIYHDENSTFGQDMGNYRDDAMHLRNQNGAENYPLLRAWGKGHFVGCCFHVDTSEMPYERACCESDHAVFIDHDPKRTMWGTGCEDYVNDAWGYHKNSGLLSGGTQWPNKSLFGYRFHVSDPITFSKKLAFTLEHGSSNNCTGRYHSVAYYYLLPAGPNPFIDGVSPRPSKPYFNR